MTTPEKSREELQAKGLLGKGVETGRDGVSPLVSRCSSLRKSNLIFPLLPSAARALLLENIPRLGKKKPRISYLNSTPACAMSPVGDLKGESANAKTRERNFQGGGSCQRPLAALNYLSRGPHFLRPSASLDPVETKKISFRPRTRAVRSTPSD